MALSTNSAEFDGRLCATMKWTGATHETGRWYETGETFCKHQHRDEVPTSWNRVLAVPSDDALT